MTTHTGLRLPGPLRYAVPISPNLDQHVQWHDESAGRVRAPASGPRTDTVPVPESPRLRAGARLRSFGDDWYHRLHVRPARLDLGNLLARQTRQVEIWNAHFTDQALTGLDASGTDGLIASGIVVPSAFAPLQSRWFTLEIDTAGPATIDARYVFHFASADVALVVVGRRVVVFGLRPNWREPLRESLEWLTDVLVADDGSEQRVRLREAPRRTFEWLASAEGRDMRLLDNLLWGWQGRVYCLPVWTDRWDLPAALPAGSAGITVPTAYADYHAGGLAILWRSPREYEAVEVLAVESGGITLARQTEAEWAAGTRVYPARLARLPAEQSVTRHTGRLAEVLLTFEVADPDGGPVVDAGPVYLGYPVLTTPCETSDPPDDQYVRRLLAFDHPTGRPVYADRATYPAVTQGYRWRVGTRAAIQAHRAWLGARAGRLVPCWAATWRQDFVQTRTLGAAAVTLAVQADGYRDLVAAHPARRHLLLRHRDGTVYCRRIVGAAELTADEDTLTLDSPIGREVAPGDLVMIAYLHLVRLAADRVELTWHTDALVETAVGLTALPSPP